MKKKNLKFSTKKVSFNEERDKGCIKVFATLTRNLNKTRREHF
jgi:hypothetical protein